MSCETHRLPDDRLHCYECDLAATEAELDASRAALAEVTRERDDYRQAWQRDLAKGREFLAERDALATRLRVAREALTWAAEWFNARAKQVGELHGYDGQGVPGALGIRAALNGYAEKCRAALAAPTPPVPPPCPTCGDANCDSLLPWDPPPCPKAAPLAVPVPPGPPTAEACAAELEHCAFLMEQEKKPGAKFWRAAARWLRDGTITVAAPATPNPAPQPLTIEGLPGDTDADPGYPTPASPKACASWCGKAFDSHSHGANSYTSLLHRPGVGRDGILDSSGLCWCNDDCRAAGRPLHPAPAQKPPADVECPVCKSAVGMPCDQSVKTNAEPWHGFHWGRCAVSDAKAKEAGT